MNVFTRIFASRKVWIALAAVAMCILTIFGADQEKWMPLITAIVTLAGVVIAAIGIEDGAAKLSGEFPTDETAVPPKTSTAKALIPLLFTACCLLLTAGCAVDRVSVQADQARKTAVEPVVREYIEHHPEQATTWLDFLTSWQKSIDARAKN